MKMVFNSISSHEISRIFKWKQRNVICLSELEALKQSSFNRKSFQVESSLTNRNKGHEIIGINSGNSCASVLTPIKKKQDDPDQERKATLRLFFRSYCRSCLSASIEWDLASVKSSYFHHIGFCGRLVHRFIIHWPYRVPHAAAVLIKINVIHLGFLEGQRDVIQLMHILFMTVLNQVGQWSIPLVNIAGHDKSNESITSDLYK